MRAFDTGDKTPDGKVRYFITDYDTDHLEYRGDKWFPSKIPDVLGEKFIKNHLKIPCGHCLGCRLEYSKVWAERILAEKLVSNTAFFITLTYNDDTIPRVIQNKDCVEDAYSLLKRDTQLFFKRLRSSLKRDFDGKYKDVKIRYFLAGEYSPKMRPHYHAVVFNIPEEVLQLEYWKTKNGNHYFLSPYLDKLWNLGYVVVGDCTVQSAAYVARYCMKKVQAGTAGIDWKSIYVDLGINPEFVTMSRRPGIGLNWFSDNYKKVVDYQSIPIRTQDGPQYIGINRYYKEKLKEMLTPEQFEKWQNLREVLGRKSFKNELMASDLDEIEYLLVKEQAVASKIKSLKREVIE